MKATLMTLLTFAAVPSFGKGEAIAFDRLMNEVNARTVFTLTTNDPSCPKLVRPVIGEIPKDAKPGDKYVRLNTSISGQPYDRFTHEGSEILYRPGLAVGKVHSIDRSLSFLLGAAYRSQSQLEEDGILTTKTSIVVASVAMSVKADYFVSYDSNAGKISYLSRGHGVTTVNCVYSKQENGNP